MRLKKIAIPEHDVNYGDNEANVAYLYRGFYIWKTTVTNVGLRGGTHDEWCFGPADRVTPDDDYGENFEPYWTNGNPTREMIETRGACVRMIDRIIEQEANKTAGECV